MLTAQQVIDAIHGSYQTGSKNGHRNVLALLDALGVTMAEGQYDPKIIHVAGTNGKGSTCAMLAAVLKAAGYRIGLYTSPFLQHYQERIRIGGVPLTDDLMVKYGNPLVEAAKALEAQGDFVTPFEMGTALALAAFAGEKCDFAVIEVGMGGRLDPTNIVQPVACAITAIGLDHMGYLGDTLEQIAGEKAGIIKENVPVVCYPAESGVRQVFADAAARQNAPLVQLDESGILHAEGDAHGSTVTYRLGRLWPDMRIGLPGQYQQRNAMTVLALVETLTAQGHAIPEEAVRRGLAEAVWPARLEWAGNVLIDGAHNPQGVDALVQYVDNYLPDRRRVLLTGVLSDKLQPEMLAQMVHIAWEIVTVTPDTPRAMPAAEYAAHLNALGAWAVPADTLAEGLAMAQELAGADGVVIAAGSLYFAGGLRSVMNLPWK
ncbi:MAG: bifunctional folylpolyglutamate synthase/dihydrofolate synthase [Clostridia bacterium]|nr:bifunctional folylpolyglutamate synthase/dihydrofolate synthase [Clostridia bacterium]